MADDTDHGWLKKNPLGNPLRLSLRRSNHFYARSPDMDSSILSRSGKSHLLAVPVPSIARRSSATLDKLKQMNFKKPTAPVLKKNDVKKIHSGLPRPTNHMHVKPSPSRNNNLNSRISLMVRLEDIKKSSLYGAKTNPYVATSQTATRNGRPNIVQRMKQISEITLERSLDMGQAQHQSTPTVTIVPRSILKNTQSSRGSPGGAAGNSNCTGNFSSKPKAAKKVNFDGLFKCDREKENVSVKEVGKEEAPVCPPSKPDVSALDESTTAFSNHFQPIQFDEAIQKQLDKRTQTEPNKIIQEQLDEAVEQQPNEVVNRHPHEPENLDNHDMVVSTANCEHGNVFPSWSLYRGKMEKVYADIKLLDKSFHELLQFKNDSQTFYAKFVEHKAKREQLCEELKKLESSFAEELKNATCVNSTLIAYLDKKDTLLKKADDLHSEFKETLDVLLGKNKQNESCHEQIKTKSSCPVRSSPVNKLRKICARSKVIQKRYQHQHHRKITNSNSPDNTPARRKKLSKKIQLQLNTLFETDQSPEV